MQQQHVTRFNLVDLVSDVHLPQHLCGQQGLMSCTANDHVKIQSLHSMIRKQLPRPIQAEHGEIIYSCMQTG